MISKSLWTFSFWILGVEAAVHLSIFMKISKFMLVFSSQSSSVQTVIKVKPFCFLLPGPSVWKLHKVTLNIHAD